MAFANGYTYRKAITVDHTKVSGTGDLTDFPILISHTDADLKTTANGGNVQSTSGYDIFFETTGGSTLKHEVVFWSATTGQWIGYVKIPTLDGDASTVIYIYYGKSGVVSPTEDPPNVWNSSYKGVWHTTQDPAGSAPQILDSTSNNYDMTSGGSMTSGDLVTGQIYKAIEFDGTDDYLINTAWASVISGNGARTMEAWFNIATTPNANWVAWGAASSNQLSAIGVFSNAMGYLGYGNDNTTSAAPYDDSAWHQVAITHNGTTMKVLIDGTEVISVSETIATAASADLYFARYISGDYFPGKLEEIRISDTGRSNDWCITGYNSMKNPGTFYSLGSQQTSDGTFMRSVIII
jgi:hypothetical protein